jgi:hypothetical protein
MRRRLAILLLAAASVAAAADPLAGEWQANLQKSKRDPNHRFSQASMRIEVEGHNLRLIIEGANQAVKPVKQTQELLVLIQLNTPSI